MTHSIHEIQNPARNQWLTSVILATWGGRDQEGQGLKPTWANSSRDPISKKNHHKTGLVEWLKV
jgi:hypothetical protein